MIGKSLPMVKLFSWMLLGICWAQQVLTKYTRDLYPSILENFLALLDNFIPFIFTLSELLLGGYYTLWLALKFYYLFSSFYLFIFWFCFFEKKNTLYILEQFRVTASVNERYRGCPCTPGPYACIASHTLKIPYQNGTLITVDELTWTHHNHLKSILTLGFMLGVVYTMGFEKCQWHVYTTMVSYRIGSLP